MLERLEVADLHTHILPGIDDGARDLAAAEKLYRTAKKQGVDRIALTPHFYYERQDLQEFLARRDEMYAQLLEVCESGMKLGAEVHYTTALQTLDISRLAIEGTPYILVELQQGTPPLGAGEVFGSIMDRGYIPLIAHVERYSYLYNNPVMLYEWVANGCLIQTNASVFLKASDGSPARRHARRFINKCISWNLIHVIASDCHNSHERRPNLVDALAEIDSEERRYYMSNALAIFKGREPKIREPILPRKNIFGSWG